MGEQHLLIWENRTIFTCVGNQPLPTYATYLSSNCGMSHQFFLPSLNIQREVALCWKGYLLKQNTGTKLLVASNDSTRTSGDKWSNTRVAKSVLVYYLWNVTMSTLYKGFDVHLCNFSAVLHGVCNVIEFVVHVWKCVHQQNVFLVTPIKNENRILTPPPYLSNCGKALTYALVTLVPSFTALVTS